MVNMPPENFKCKQYGNCCINLGDSFTTCATEEDIYLYEEEGRDDILEWVGFIPLGDEYVYDLWITFSPCIRIRSISVFPKYSKWSWYSVFIS
jgi:hypothetical protein